MNSARREDCSSLWMSARRWRNVWVRKTPLATLLIERKVPTVSGAFCFGLVVGFVTYRTLRHITRVRLNDIAGVIGAIGGGAVLNLFPPDTGVIQRLRIRSRTRLFPLSRPLAHHRRGVERRSGESHKGRGPRSTEGRRTLILALGSIEHERLRGSRSSSWLDFLKPIQAPCADGRQGCTNLRRDLRQNLRNGYLKSQNSRPFESHSGGRSSILIGSTKSFNNLRRVDISSSVVEVSNSRLILSPVITFAS